MIGLPVQSLRDVVGRNAQRTVNALRLAGGLVTGLRRDAHRTW